MVEKPKSGRNAHVKAFGSPWQLTSDEIHWRAGFPGWIVCERKLEEFGIATMVIPQVHISPISILSLPRFYTFLPGISCHISRIRSVYIPSISINSDDNFDAEVYNQTS